MPTRWGVVCLVLCLFPGLLYGPDKACCSETCTIGGNHVLLYKVINFWYDCLPGEAGQLCGARLKCRSAEGARVKYNPEKSLLEIHINAAFRRLVLVLNPGAEVFLKATMTNRAYFGGGRAAALTVDLDGVDCFRILDADKDHYRKVQGIEGNIGIEVEGSIGGLLDGKIALYRGSGAMKSCPEDAFAAEDAFPLSLKLINIMTGEVLAAYTVAPGQ